MAEQITWLTEKAARKLAVDVPEDLAGEFPNVAAGRVGIFIEGAGAESVEPLAEELARYLRRIEGRRLMPDFGTIVPIGAPGHG